MTVCAFEYPTAHQLHFSMSSTGQSFQFSILNKNTIPHHRPGNQKVHENFPLDAAKMKIISLSTEVNNVQVHTHIHIDIHIHIHAYIYTYTCA